MKILALDTATENCSAALLISGALLCREELIGRGHAISAAFGLGEVFGYDRAESVPNREVAMTAIASKRHIETQTAVNFRCTSTSK